MRITIDRCPAGRFELAQARPAGGRGAAPACDRLGLAAAGRERRARADRRARARDWNRKHQAVRFAREVGLGPKTVARILRFARARRAILCGAVAADWAGLALECGYADQAHLIREFQALAGATPRAYADLDHLPVTNFQDGA